MEPHLPGCTRAECSDSDERSPWSKKTILSLDGGGIKGYSSLLVIKRLMYLIEQIERGIIPAEEDGSEACDPDPIPGRRQYLVPNDSSEYYSWFPRELDALSVAQRKELSPGPSTIDSVDRTFSSTCATSKFEPHHYFDYLVGTSTGGLSAIMLGRMELSIENALEQYDTVGSQVFGHPRFISKHVPGASLVRPKYAAERMANALQAVTKVALAEEIKQWKTEPAAVPFASDPQRSRTIAVARGKNLTRRSAGIWQPYLFRSYDHLHPSPLAPPTRNKRHLNPGHAHRLPIWQVARATSAAPTYFNAQKGDGFIFKDGGLGTNNPARVAWDEVLQLHEQRPFLLLSVGTGKATKDIVRPRKRLPGILDPLVENLDVIKLMEDIVTETEKIHENMQDDMEGYAKYYRMNVSEGVGNIPLDEWEPKDSGKITKDKMLEATKRYLSYDEVNDRLTQCARNLVRLRRRRARTERWEQFACRVAYYCPEVSCQPQGRTFLTRDELRHHALDAHSFVQNVTVRGHPTLQHACYWDHCLHDGVHVFEVEQEYLRHLRHEHHIQRLRFKTRRELEQWLDTGRITQQAAFMHRLSELEEMERAARAQQAGGLQVCSGQSSSGSTRCE